MFICSFLQAFGNPVDPNLPSPPPYSETEEQAREILGHQNRPRPPRSPSSMNSSQSEMTLDSRHQSDDDSSSTSSSDEGSRWDIYRPDGEGRRERITRHESSSGSDHSRARSQLQLRSQSTPQANISVQSDRSNSVTGSMTQGTELSHLDEGKNISRKTNEDKPGLQTNVFVSHDALNGSKLEGKKETYNQTRQPSQDNTIRAHSSSEIVNRGSYSPNHQIPPTRTKPVPAKRNLNHHSNLKSRSVSVEHMLSEPSTGKQDMGLNLLPKQGKTSLLKSKSVENLGTRQAFAVFDSEAGASRYQYDNLAARFDTEDHHDGLVVYDFARNGQPTCDHPLGLSGSASNISRNHDNHVAMELPGRRQDDRSVSDRAGEQQNQTPSNRAKARHGNSDGLHGNRSVNHGNRHDNHGTVEDIDDSESNGRSRMSFVWEGDDSTDVFV